MIEFDGNADELQRRMQLDDLHDAQKLTPIEYGRLRGKTAQLVYYHIRSGHIPLERCLCGKKVIDVKSADEYFQVGEFTPTNNLNLERDPSDDD